MQEMVNDPDAWHESEHEAMLEAYALLSAIEEAGLMRMPVILPSSIPADEWRADCSIINQYLTELRTSLQANLRVQSVARTKAKFASLLSQGFGYQFSAADVNRMQTLINELRQEISTSDLFDDGHKSRLLKRLEHLQGEVHKKISDLDRFWGLIGDAGVAMGKFGTSAKPFVDRIVELTQIVWNAQKEAEQLPSNVEMPLLPDLSASHGPRETIES